MLFKTTQRTGPILAVRIILEKPQDSKQTGCENDRGLPSPGRISR